MNNIQKFVASNTRKRVDEWNNPVLLNGDLVEGIQELKIRQDVIVVGSDSIVQSLKQHDLVDEYRLLTFPIVLGAGRCLFQDGIRAFALRLVKAEQSGEALLAIYRRESNTA